MSLVDTREITLPELHEAEFGLGEMPSDFFDELKMEEIIQMENEIVNHPREVLPEPDIISSSGTRQPRESGTREDAENHFNNVLHESGYPEDNNPSISEAYSKVIRLEKYSEVIEIPNERMYRILQNYQRTMCSRKKTVPFYTTISQSNSGI